MSLYLWRQDAGLYELTLERGQPDTPLMRTIAQRPFTDGFAQGFYSRPVLEQWVQRGVPGQEEAALKLRTMDAMAADLTIPIQSGDLVLGWVNLRDERWSDGYSADEIRRLERTVGRASVILENIYSFEQLRATTARASAHVGRSRRETETHSLHRCRAVPRGRGEG